MPSTMPMSLYKYNADELKVLLIGDIHWGSKHCLMGEFLQALEYAQSDPEIKVILMGDLIECATKSSVGAGWAGQHINPQEQIDEMCDLLRPLADNRQILGIHTGNHEQRAMNISGIDITKMICKDLGVPNYGFSRFTRIKVVSDKHPKKRGENYYFFTTHGSSGATLPHTKIRGCLNLANSFGADIFATGHVHELQHHKSKFFIPDEDNKTAKERHRHFILTGHFLDYKNSYAEMKNLRPSETGYVKIKLRGDKHGIYVSF